MMGALAGWEGACRRSTGLSHPDFDPSTLTDVTLFVPAGEPAVGINELGARQWQDAKGPEPRVGGQHLDHRQRARKPEPGIVGPIARPPRRPFPRSPTPSGDPDSKHGW